MPLARDSAGRLVRQPPARQVHQRAAAQIDDGGQLVVVRQRGQFGLGTAAVKPCTV